MKVIRSGAKPGWWIGKQINCKCGFVAELEMNDSVKEYKNEGLVQIYVTCPECQSEIRLFYDARKLSC